MYKLGKQDTAASAASSRNTPPKLPGADSEATSRAAGPRATMPCLQEPRQQDGSQAGLLLSHLGSAFQSCTSAPDDRF